VINDASKGGIDRLGFKVYAEAIKNALVLASIPICVGIYGKWGSGKTFLLELIKKEFDSNIVENFAKDGLIQWFHDDWIKVKLKGDTSGLNKEVNDNCCRLFCLSTVRFFFYNYTVVTIYSLISENLLGITESSTVNSKNYDRSPSMDSSNDVESNSKKIEKEYLFVTFNALEYAESDELYAGLIRALYEITEKRLSEHNSEAYFKAYDYKENKSSVDYLRKWRIKRAKDLLLEQFGGREQLLASLIAFVLLVIGTTLLIILDACYVINLTDLITWSTNSYTSIASYFGFIVTLVPSISLFYGANRTSVISRGDEIYREASDQNLRDNIGFLNKVVNELKDLFEFMSEFREDTNIDLTLVVFVDDLDRCFNGRVVKVLEVIQLLISIPSAPVILFLAVDTSIVVPGIEEVINKSLGIRDSLTTGWSYLEKIIQLPFCLPQPLSNILKEFISMSVRKNIINLNERVTERLQNLINRISAVHDTVRLDNMDTELTYFVTDSHQHKRKFNFDRLREAVTALVKPLDNIDICLDSTDRAMAILKSAMGEDHVHSVSHEKDKNVKKQLIEDLLFHLLEAMNSVSIDSDKHTKNEFDKYLVNDDDNGENYQGNMSKNELFNKKLITVAQNKLRNLKTDDFSLPGHIRSLISSLSDYMDKNPRKIKRIINMLLLVFEVAKRKIIKVGVTNLIITELHCWTLFSRKLTLWIVLCEVYPFRMSMLVSRLIDFEQQLECNQHTMHSSIDIFYKARAEDIHDDVQKIDEMTVSRFYFCYVESYIYTVESSRKLLRIDGDPANFTRLLSYDVSLNTFDPKYLLCTDILVTRRSDRLVDLSILAYSFNLDPSIREQLNIEISELTTDYELFVRQSNHNMNFNSDDSNTTIETQPSQHAGKSVLRKNHVERKQNIIMKAQYNSYNSSDELSPIPISSSTNYGSII
jgi:succinate dehydrogenase assembly factor 1